MSLVLYWINPVGVFYVGLMILAGAGIYFGVLILLKGFGKEVELLICSPVSL